MPKVRRFLLLFAAVAFVVFLGIQFIRPALPAGPITGESQASPAVTQILRTSCYNCHSNETRLAWFDRIVPAYWLVVSDVKQAREKLNFSEFGQLPAAQERGVLFEALNQMQFGAMPPKKYVLLHAESRVTPETLPRWSNT
ncbi:MAG: heme-binding domain-containing protein [Bryobacteraceae bacterium]